MASKKKNCQYELSEEERCRYPFFKTWEDPETGEEKHYCIFHAPMEAKEDNIDKFWEAFDVQFEKTEKEYDAANDEEKKRIWLNCEGVVFPDTGGRFTGREFCFNVYFADTKFSGKASFPLARFLAEVDFSHAQFAGGAYFTNARFSGYAYFAQARFFGDAFFSSVQFSDRATFSESQFLGYTWFAFAKFTGAAYFGKTEFTGTANFGSAQFTGAARFSRAQFTGPTDFRLAQFANDANFEGVNFGAVATFEMARFLSYTDFRRITVEKDGESAGTILFRYVFFSDPSRVYVGGPGITRCSTVGTNIEGVQFVDPEWSRRKGRFKKYRKKAFDEELAEKGVVNGDDEVKVTWEDAVEVYRKLRRNFEGRLAYETAGDFHYGQMECRRKNKDKKGFLAWCDRRLIGAYKFFFSYGESILKPFLWFWLLVGVLILALGPVLAIRSLFSFGVPPDVCLTQLIISQVGRLGAVVLITFFILALRRRFKR